MTLIRASSLLFAILIALAGQAQQSQILLFVDSSDIIGQISDDKLLVGPRQVAFSLQGNTLYSGDSKNFEDALLFIGVTDIFSKKRQEILFPNSKDVAYTIRKGVLYLGERSAYDDLEQLLRVEPTEQGYFAVYSGIDNSYLGTIASDRQIRPAEFIAALHRYVLHYNLDRQVNALLQAQLNTDSQIRVSSGGTIRPAWGNNPYMEWTWDGQFLKPSWGIRAEDEWKFDGKFIRPQYGTVSREEWVWDGQILKKYWSGDTELQWIWDRSSLRPYWDANTGTEYIFFDDGTIGPRFNRDPYRTWIIEGDVPRPIIAMVILGFADR